MAIPSWVLMVEFGFGVVVAWLSVTVIELFRGLKSVRGHEVTTSDREVEVLFGVGVLVLLYLSGGPAVVVLLGGGVGLAILFGWGLQWLYREVEP